MTFQVMCLVISLIFTFGFSASVEKAKKFDIEEVIESITYQRAMSDLQSSAEVLIDTNFAFIPQTDSQKYPSIAFDGTNYLVVWEDWRGDGDIYGTRVSQEGFVLDPFGIAISNAENRQVSPSVAFDGINYFVVWEDWRGDGDIYGSRVNQSGIVLDTAGITITHAIISQRNPAIDFDGTNYLVVWVDYWRGGIYGTRINPSGVVLDTSWIAISIDSYYQRCPTVAFDGTNYLVVWHDYRNSAVYPDIYGARISQAGIVLDTTGIAISTAQDGQSNPSVVFGETSYFVIWQDERNGGYDIYGTRVRQNGIVLDPNGIPISTAAGDQSSPCLAFDGVNYLVVWEDWRSGDTSDIWGTRVNQDGLVLDPNGITMTIAVNSQYFPSVAFDGVNYIISWQDLCRSDYDIYCSRVDQFGTVLDTTGVIVSTESYAYVQNSSAVAFDGTNYLVVWHDYRNSSVYPDIYGARINQAGIVLDPAGIAISTAQDWQSNPSVAFDGVNYLVVWQDRRSGTYSDIYGTRVTQAGVILDSTGIAISTANRNQNSPAIAFDGTNYLVVWEDWRSGVDIYGTRINQEGLILDTTGIAISTDTNYQWSPCLAYDGNNYFVVWSDRRISSYDIYGARISPVGIVLDPAGIAISSAQDGQSFPSITFDGMNYFVVWEDQRNSIYDSNIYGSRVNQSGIVLDTAGIVITAIAGLQKFPSVMFANTNYLVVWEDWRNDSCSDIYGVTVSLTGTIIDTFAVSLQTGNQLNPALALGTGNQLIISYSGWVDSINEHPANTMRLWGRFYPLIGINEDHLTFPVDLQALEIFPNPAKSVVNVHCPVLVKEIKIFDASGKLVKVAEKVISEQEHMQEIRISLKGINPGVYFLRLGKETKKFLVVK